MVYTFFCHLLIKTFKGILGTEIGSIMDGDI